MKRDAVMAVINGDGHGQILNRATPPRWDTPRVGVDMEELARLPPALAQKLSDLAMKEPAAPNRGGLGDPDNASLAPYEVPATLRDTIDALDMWQNLADMETQGYTVLTGCANQAQCEAQCEALCELLRPAGQGHVLGNCFDNEHVWSAVTAPKMMALCEVMCGKGFRLSQCAASVQQQNPTQTGLPTGGLYADANWTPAPFPEHN